MWSKAEKGAQAGRVVISKMVAGESPSDKLTFEQRLKGEEQGTLWLCQRLEREGYPGRGEKQIQRLRGKAKSPEWLRHSG